MAEKWIYWIEFFFQWTHFSAAKPLYIFTITLLLSILCSLSFWKTSINVLYEENEYVDNSNEKKTHTAKEMEKLFLKSQHTHKKRGKENLCLWSWWCHI